MTAMPQKLLFTNEVADAIRSEIELMSPNRVFVLADDNTAREVLPSLGLPDSVTVLTMTPGDDSKTLSTAMEIWGALTDGEATRHSMLINIGGGVVTDLGGFVAATFKRGMRFVNVPTTLLSAVDAAVGGKTGVNFHGYKNEIGAFCEADTVIISSRYFATLPATELLSGYAEMLKHGLLSGVSDVSALMREHPAGFSDAEMLDLLRRSVAVKQGVVSRDPHERGERKVLNLGHTVGHAIESLALHRGHPVPHGYAVAWGLVAELVLSHMQLGFDSTLLHQFAAYVADNYGAPQVSCKDYDALMGYMSHDKKNATSSVVNFTLLRAPGDALYDCTVDDPAAITAALDITLDLLHA